MARLAHQRLADKRSTIGFFRRSVSVVELTAFGFDGLGQRQGFGFLVAQLGWRRLQGGDRGQEFFPGLGDPQNVGFWFWFWF